jgi:GTPase SAR1 family protein
MEPVNNPDLAAVIDQALNALEPLDADLLAGSGNLSELRQRLAEGRFRLAVLGQFKRGKSTFLNALLGEDLLPTDILPVTAIPTFIQAAEQLCARVLFADEREPVRFVSQGKGSLGNFLQDYVTEVGNPDNQRRVKRVEVEHPSAILQQGVVLVDTPGIGSTFRHNTEVAYQILPECDAAVFLVSPDPPITEAEIDYLRQIREFLPRTFFLLNKVDFLDEAELSASLAFLSDQLEPLCDGAPQVLPVSAKKGLAARLRGDAAGWASSGMQQVEQNLIDFFAREKQQTFQASLWRRINDQLNTLIMQLQLSLEAMQLPEAELKEKIAQFQKVLPDIEREKQAAADVVAGDHNRIVKVLGKEVEAVREGARQAMVPRVEEIIRSVADTEEVERLVRSLVARELPVYFAPAMRRVDESIRRQAKEFLALHQQRCDQLIERVRKLAAELFNIPYHAPLVERVYVHFDAPGWSQDLFISDLDPLGQKVSRKLFTRSFRHRRTIRRLREETLKLLNQNTEQINWTLRRTLDESFRRYAFELDEQLDRTIAATRAAMDVALQKKTSQSRQVEEQISLLRNTIATLQALALQQPLVGGSASATND